MKLAHAEDVEGGFVDAGEDRGRLKRLQSAPRPPPTADPPADIDPGAEDDEAPPSDVIIVLRHRLHQGDDVLPEDPGSEDADGTANRSTSSSISSSASYELVAFKA